jgi:hypothetical protein
VAEDKHDKHDKQEQDSSFRVIDRRLFTEQGELRPEAQEQARKDREAPPPAPTATPAGAGAASNIAAPGGTGAAPGAGATQTGLGAAPGAIGGEAPARSPHFEMLVNLIANQAAAMMGAYADPATGQAVVDLEGAREFIDMLDALREKTRGNLAAEEDRTLAEVLGSLKYTFLEMSKAAAARVSGVAAKPGSR